MTAASDVVRARVDAETKRQASEILEAMGITLSDAIRMMLVRVVAEKAIPFDVRVPNKTTRRAIAASRRGEGRRSATVDELFADLDDGG